MLDQDTRAHTIAALAVQLGARLTNPAPVIRVPHGVDPRCAELRVRGDELAARLLEVTCRERVRANERTRSEKAHANDHDLHR